MVGVFILLQVAVFSAFLGVTKLEVIITGIFKVLFENTCMTRMFVCVLRRIKSRHTVGLGTHAFGAFIYAATGASQVCPSPNTHTHIRSPTHAHKPASSFAKYQILCCVCMMFSSPGVRLALGEGRRHTSSRRLQLQISHS